MTQSNHEKMLKQLEVKPWKHGKFKKHNAPKERKHGVKTKSCRICGRHRSTMKSYGLMLCRQCFREIAAKIGFKKYG